ncbi:peptidoglycan recognition protein family protein [Streptomyces camelliae]|uniref:peptidoglycan recognition protein family protein n=1 Tax=Streptomyces camelliae TaxID=3004093 RepID=UPI003D183282
MGPAGSPGPSAPLPGAFAPPYGGSEPPFAAAVAPGGKAEPETGVSGRARWRGRVPVAVLVLAGCLPGVLALLALVLFTRGGDAPVTVRADRHGAGAATAPYRAHRPAIVPRSVWLGPLTPHQPPPHYDDKVIAVFLHHTDSPSSYDCADAPSIIRHLYAGQTGDRNWDDLGYNFVVDRCGTIYEGRAGGVDRPVTGAHTLGFNHRTAGIAALGTFTEGVPVPRAMTDAIAALVAWKLGLAGVDPRDSTRLLSSSSLSRYQAGTTVTLPALAGHDAGYMTSCPGAALTARLPEIREAAARLQGRPAHRNATGVPQPSPRTAP